MVGGVKVLSVKEIESITGAESEYIAWLTKKYRYCFYVPVVTRADEVGNTYRTPRCPKSMQFAAIYAKGGHFAFVFTNSKYLADKKYAIPIRIR